MEQIWVLFIYPLVKERAIKENKIVDKPRYDRTRQALLHMFKKTGKGFKEHSPKIS